MGPDVLMSSGGGGASIPPGAHANTGIGRISSPAHLLLNRRKWWCCGVRRRRKSSFKHNTVNSFPINFIIIFFFFFLKDRANNNNTANLNDEALDEELGDFQMPLSLTPRHSTSTGHVLSTTNVIQHRLSTSSLQPIVVLHSNTNEILIIIINR